MTKANTTFSYHGQSVEGSTLIMPSPNGIAYMGQLCVDLLVQNMNMKRIGYIDSCFVNGFVGSNSFTGDLNDLTTAFEGNFSIERFIKVFSFSGPNEIFTVLQLRSRVIEVLLKSRLDKRKRLKCLSLT